MAAAKKRILKQHFYEQIQLEQKEMELKVQRENDLIEFQRQQMVFQMQRQNQERMELERQQMAFQIQQQYQEKMELERQQRALQFQRENQEKVELEREQMAIKLQQENHAQLKRNLAAKLRLQQWNKRKNEENQEALKDNTRMKIVGEVPKYSFGNPRFTPYSECPQYIREMYQHRQYYDPYQEESKDLQLSYHHNNYKQADPSPTTPIIQNTAPIMANVNQPSGSPVNVHGIDRKGHDYNNGEYHCVCGTNYLAKKELFDHIREMCKLHGAWISCQL